MSSATLETVRVVVPLLPLILRQSLLHVLRLSDSSKYLDLRSALIIACLRVILIPKTPRSISEVQRLTLRDPGVKGHIWVSRYASPPPPENSIRDALIAALEHVGGSTCRVPVPDLVDVEAEWTGYRSSVTRGAPLPDVSERERYHGMMQECKRPTTVLYLHGGAYYLCDPATHRPTTKKLAQLTGGRCYSVRYRLAPQHPFPAALLDAFVSYFTLLYPPPDAYHDPVQPEHIVIAGDRYVSCLISKSKSSQRVSRILTGYLTALAAILPSRYSNSSSNSADKTLQSCGTASCARFPCQLA